MTQTTETAFETYSEEILLALGGWSSGTNAGWEKERALFPAQVFGFLQDSQPKLLQRIWGRHISFSKSLSHQDLQMVAKENYDR